MGRSDSSKGLCRIGILGGSFDPVHQGHLGIARAAWRRLGLDSLHFIPLRQLPDRPSPIASADQRREMLALALAQGFPGSNQALVNTCELRRPEPSHTVHTLHTLRERFPQAVLLWLLGEDAFASLESWQDWQRLLDHAHLVVITRRGSRPPALSSTLQQWMQGHLVEDSAALLAMTHGRIYRLNIRPIPISSSAIRQCLAAGQSVRAVLPAPVQDYILSHRPYPMARASECQA